MKRVSQSVSQQQRLDISVITSYKGKVTRILPLDEAAASKTVFVNLSSYLRRTGRRTADGRPDGNAFGAS